LREGPPQHITRHPARRDLWFQGDEGWGGKAGWWWDGGLWIAGFGVGLRGEGKFLVDKWRFWALAYCVNWIAHL
jgi:hypothetical protein